MVIATLFTLPPEAGNPASICRSRASCATLEFHRGSFSIQLVIFFIGNPTSIKHFEAVTGVLAQLLGPATKRFSQGEHPALDILQEMHFSCRGSKRERAFWNCQDRQTLESRIHFQVTLLAGSTAGTVLLYLPKGLHTHAAGSRWCQHQQHTTRGALVQFHKSLYRQCLQRRLVATRVHPLANCKRQSRKFQVDLQHSKSEGSWKELSDRQARPSTSQANVT